MPAKKTLQDCINIATGRGGKCVSTVYENHQTDLTWECARGHQFKATYNNVSNKHSWCPDCNVNLGEEITRGVVEFLFGVTFKKCRPEFLNGMELDGYNEEMEFGFEFQGIQHYESIPHFHRTPTAFQEQKARDESKAKKCSDEGVTLLIVPYWEYNKGVDELIDFIIAEIDHIGYGTSLLTNTITQDDVDKILKTAYNRSPAWDEKLQDIREHVEAKGYKLLSTIYMGLRKYKYDVQCDQGHVYHPTGDTIKDARGRGCSHPDCNGKPIINDVVIRNFATQRFYTYHDVYHGKNSASLLKFKCVLGHDINMSWDNFKQYKSCKHCFGRTARSTTLTCIKKMAELHGGRCLSDHYTNKETIMKFVCEAAHELQLSAHELIRGKWCEKCEKIN